MPPTGPRALHDAQLRGRLPKVPPVGAVIEQDGPLIRTHYGTHGTIDYRHLPTTDLGTLVTRQRDAFAERGERGEWKIYAHDAPADLPAELRKAGFTPGWTRALLVASLDEIEVASPAVLRDADDVDEVERTAAGAGPQRTPLTAFLADGRWWSLETVVLTTGAEAPLNATAWAEHVPGTSFVVIGGIVDPNLTLIPHLSGWDWKLADRPGCAGPMRATSSPRRTARAGPRSSGRASRGSPPPRPTTGRRLRRPPRPGRWRC